MIVSFTGAQSTGKTTLLNILKSKNKDINFIDEVTRRINREYDLPINESGSTLTQLMIIADHIANIYRKYDSDLVILDRCIIDGLVYSEWLYDNNNISISMIDLATEIYHYIYKKYDIIFYTDPKDVELVDDGERSINKHFRDDIISSFEYRIKSLNNVVVLSGTVEERLETVKKTFEKYNLDINI
jgi:nicotinamide riboside kinase